MEVKLNEEDFKKIQPFFLEMRRVGDYDQYLTMSIGEIQRKLKDTPNDPTLKAIVEFTIPVDVCLTRDKIYVKRDVTLNQYVKLMEDYKEFTTKPEEKIEKPQEKVEKFEEKDKNLQKKDEYFTKEKKDHLGRKHPKEDPLDNARKRQQEMRQERRKRVLEEHRKQDEIESIKLKDLKEEYGTYLEKKMINGEEVNINEQVEIIENNKEYSRRIKDESIDFMKKVVMTLNPWNEHTKVLEQQLREQNLQFVQIYQAGSQQLLNFKSEITRLQSENEQLKIKLDIKDKEESDRINQATKDLTSATDAIKTYLEKELENKPEIKPASEDRETVEDIREKLSNYLGQVENLDTDIGKDVRQLKTILSKVIDMMKKRDTAVDPQALKAFNAIDSNNSPFSIKNKLKNLIQSLKACNFYEENEEKKVEEMSLKSAKERLRDISQTSSEDVHYSYSEELVNDVRGSMIEDATTLTEFFEKMEEIHSNIIDKYYKNQYKKIIKNVLNYPTSNFNNERNELKILKNVYNSSIKSLLMTIIKQEPKSADIEEWDNRPKPQKETFNTKLREIIRNGNIMFKDNIGEIWYNAAQEYLKYKFSNENDVLRFYKVLVKNETLPRIFEEHLYEILEDELDADTVSENLKKVLKEIIRDYEVTQEFKKIAEGGDAKKEEELKQSESTETLEKSKDETIEEKHSVLAKKLLEYERKRSNADEFVSEVGKKILSQKFIKGDESVIRQLKYSPLLDIFRVVNDTDKPIFKTNFEFIQSVLGETQFKCYVYDSLENSIIYDALP